MATFLQVPRDVYLSATCDLFVYSNIYTGDKNELVWQNSNNFDYHYNLRLYSLWRFLISDRRSLDIWLWCPEKRMME